MQNTLLKGRVKKAIRIFYKNDFSLIENKTNERSISHKIAEYLQQEFPEYNVDCEYNRMSGKKRFTPKKLFQNIAQISSDCTKVRTVYPDIIIHHRGFNDGNLLVIEIKKIFDLNKNGKDADIKKIYAYIEELKYKHGLFLVLYKTLKETLTKFEENWISVRNKIYKSCRKKL